MISIRILSKANGAERKRSDLLTGTVGAASSIYGTQKAHHTDISSSCRVGGGRNILRGEALPFGGTLIRARKEESHPLRVERDQGWGETGGSFQKKE